MKGLEPNDLPAGYEKFTADKKEDCEIPLLDEYEPYGFDMDDSEQDFATVRLLPPDSSNASLLIFRSNTGKSSWNRRIGYGENLCRIQKIMITLMKKTNVQVNMEIWIVIMAMRVVVAPPRSLPLPQAPAR